LAGEMADGLILSVKNVEESLEQAVKPAKRAAESDVTVVASRWTVYAKDDEEAWQALGGQRGLRAPQRDTETDPVVLRKYVDNQPRDEMLKNYVLADSMEDITANYLELVEELKADKIGLQIASVDPITTIEQLADEVLPKLRRDK
jgi:alkanesulfonate monooxygenase SsuD/methylene tetrahydromethanopterin reductase-like flavin-dependent oxidoreductase (luciferase family)